MFDNFHDAIEEALYRASLDGKIYGLVQKVDKIVVRIVRKSVPNKFMWTTKGKRNDYYDYQKLDQQRKCTL